MLNLKALLAIIMMFRFGLSLKSNTIKLFRTTYFEAIFIFNEQVIEENNEMIIFIYFMLIFILMLNVHI